MPGSAGSNAPPLVRRGSSREHRPAGSAADPRSRPASISSTAASQAGRPSLAAPRRLRRRLHPHLSGDSGRRRPRGYRLGRSDRRGPDRAATFFRWRTTDLAAVRDPGRGDPGRPAGHEHRLGPDEPRAGRGGGAACRWAPPHTGKAGHAVKWNLRLAAANRGIWKASELQRMLADHGLTISAGKMSGLWSGAPASIKLADLDVICAVLAVTSESSWSLSPTRSSVPSKTGTTNWPRRRLPPRREGHR